MWSHKPGTIGVRNRPFSDSSVCLCDNNIAEYIGDSNGNVSYSSDANYYIITKNTTIYNSWHGKRLDSGATPYQP